MDDEDDPFGGEEPYTDTDAFWDEVDRQYAMKKDDEAFEFFERQKEQT